MSEISWDGDPRMSVCLKTPACMENTAETGANIVSRLMAHLVDNPPPILVPDFHPFLSLCYVLMADECERRAYCSNCRAELFFTVGMLAAMIKEVHDEIIERQQTAPQ